MLPEVGKDRGGGGRGGGRGLGMDALALLSSVFPVSLCTSPGRFQVLQLQGNLGNAAQGREEA